MVFYDILWEMREPLKILREHLQQCASARARDFGPDSRIQPQRREATDRRRRGRSSFRDPVMGWRRRHVEDFETGCAELAVLPSFPVYVSIEIWYVVKLRINP